MSACEEINYLFLSFLSYCILKFISSTFFLHYFLEVHISQFSIYFFLLLTDNWPEVQSLITTFLTCVHFPFFHFSDQDLFKFTLSSDHSKQIFIFHFQLKLYLLTLTLGDYIAPKIIIKKSSLSAK